MEKKDVSKLTPTEIVAEVDKTADQLGPDFAFYKQLIRQIVASKPSPEPSK